MRDEPIYPQIPDEYDRWIALYFRNRLTSAYADTTAGQAPEDMAALLQRADSAQSAASPSIPEDDQAAA